MASRSRSRAGTVDPGSSRLEPPTDGFGMKNPPDDNRALPAGPVKSTPLDARVAAGVCRADRGPTRVLGAAMRRRLALAALCCPLAASAAPVRLAGLLDEAEVSRDAAGIPHIRADNEHDLFFLQGWVHAEDRLFQMDMQRRQAAGTLAELLGPGALPSDVQLRTIGLQRAAVRSLPLLSARARAALEAYAQGVNASAAAHALPPEYGALKLTKFTPWSALDSAAIGKLLAFGLSFDLDDISRTVALLTYQGALGVPKGTALFFQDVFRSAPFDPASTIPDALMATPPLPRGQRDFDASRLHPRAAELGKKLLDSIRGDRFLRWMVEPKDRAGSNQWAIAGRFTDTGA